MIKILSAHVAEIIIGLASGLAVGTGFVAFITVLGIIPRLIQLSKSERFIRVYMACVILGSVIGTYMSFTATNWAQPLILLILWGVFHGIFNGMLAAALTEVVNAVPIISKRLSVDHEIKWLIMAIVFGKICGSLFQWLILDK